MKTYLTLLVSAAVCLAPLSAQEPADTVFTHAVVYTVDGKNSIAEAVAVRENRIAAVGSQDDVKAFIGPGTRLIDLKGKALFPGFIDSHGHLLNLGLGLRMLDFVGTKSYEAIVGQVGVKADETARGRWVLGRGWDQNDWDDKGFPHHRALSAATPDNPVFLTRIDGHAALANRAALDIAGITRKTKDPAGGKILRDKKGRPTGVLVDTAQDLVRRHVPPPGAAQTRKALELALAECLRHGLTSIHDPGVDAELIELYKTLIDEGVFGLRVYAMITARDMASVNAYLERGPLLNYGDHHLTVRSFKAMADGALGSRGAALLDAYADDPPNRGLVIMSEKSIYNFTRNALEGGFQVCTHAIGDRGNRMVLDAYERALIETGASDARLRIEHAQIVALEDIPRFARLGIIPSMQATHATSDMYWAEDRVGPERIKGAYAWRKFLDAGCRIANGSDFPVEGASALWGFYAAISRQDHQAWPEGGWYPAEKMTRTEALRSFTIDGAYAAFEEDLKGSIEVGKLADFVVLSKDIMEATLEEILQTKVLATMVGGRFEYESEGFR